jgi:DNA-3-methyladenine glycosylase
LINKLNKNFYTRSPLEVAPDLLGKILVRNINGVALRGIIVETEAYLGINDPASHSYRRMTERNKQMFEAGGIAYVYFTYGNHYCFNVVTGREGDGSAVLIRAVHPIRGLQYMMKNRETNDIFNLASGPGKLTKAFSIDKDLNGENITGRKIYILKNPDINRFEIVRSKRIGLSQNTDKLFRFFLKENPFISKHKFNKESKPL